MTAKKVEKNNFSKESLKDTNNKFIQRTNESAVIVGGSLAGLMTGIALARTGIRVTILEKVGSKPRSGAVLQVDSGEMDQTVTGKFLRQLASGGIRSAEAWSSVQSRLRAEVQVNPGIEIHYDTRIQTVDQDEDGAWVITDKGEIFHGDILIGADGHHSTVRYHVAPQKVNAIFAGYLIWVGIVEETDIPEKNRPDFHAPMISMPNGIGDFLLGSVIAGTDGSRALGHRRLGWAWYDNTQNDLLRRLGCVEGDVVQHSLSGPDIPEHILQELAKQAADRWPQPWLDATLHSIQTRNLTGIPVAEYVPDHLVKGRIAIVGDAAHLFTPLTAAGFNASLQDAAILADCVAKGRKGCGAAKALSEYESRRLSTVRQLVQSGQSFSRSFGRQ